MIIDKEVLKVIEKVEKEPKKVEKVKEEKEPEKVEEVKEEKELEKVDEEIDDDKKGYIEEDNDNDGVVFNCEKLNIRKEPKPIADILTQVESGTNIVILEDKGDFYEVALPDGTVGFANKNFIKK